MGKLSPKLRSMMSGERKGISFFCPGCKEMHSITYDGGGSPNWNWNGNVDRPTITPSILVTSGHYAPHFKPGSDCWCTWEDKDEFPEMKCHRCHTFVTDGRIAFLSDCTHELAGQTVDIPDLPSEMRDA